MTGKSDEQSVNKSTKEFFIKKSVDPRDSASAHLTKDNEAESTCKLRASEQNLAQGLNPLNMFGQLQIQL